MNDLRITIEQYLHAAWRRRWVGVGIAWLACLVGWAGIYVIPNKFEASARLYVDTDAILTPLLRGVAADSAPMAQLELLQRTLLSRPNLEKLISKTDLDLTIHGPVDRERTIERLQQEIKVTPQTNNLFTITYRDARPKMAYDVVQTLLTIFIESATGGNRSDMDNARRFLQNQIASYEQQLRAAEKRRADFRARYVNVLPESGSNVSAVDAARQRVEALTGQLKDAIAERDLLRRELASTPAMVSESAAVQQHTQSQLQQAEERLHMLLLKDTPDHPDVIAQERLIAALKSGAIPATGSTGDTGFQGHGRNGQAAGGSSVPNPVYDHLKVKLVDADTQVLTLTRQSEAAQQNVARLDKILREQPGLLAEYQNLDRDYGVMSSMYHELLGRLQAANVAQAADTQADKVKILVVDPPQMPHLPVAPKRGLLISAVLLLGLGAGVGAPVLFGQFDNSFGSVDSLRTLGLPVLGGISVLGIAPLRQRLMVVARIGIAVAVLVGLYGGLMVYVMRNSALI